MVSLLELASAFAQVGIGAFGGGLSTLPLIEYQLVTKTGWLTGEQFHQVLALSQVTPGPIAINAATFVGYQQAGVTGSIVATLSLIGAPIAILCVVLLALKHVSAQRSDRFMLLIRPVVAGLLTLSLLPPLSGTLRNGVSAVVLFLLGLLLLGRVKFIRKHPPLMLFAFGLIGIFLLS